jgi:hypothetical protein
MKMGRRPSRACGIGHVSIQICSAPRALPAAYFDRNESHVSYATGHLGRFLKGRWSKDKKLECWPRPHPQPITLRVAMRARATRSVAGGNNGLLEC